MAIMLNSRSNVYEHIFFSASQPPDSSTLSQIAGIAVSFADVLLERIETGTVMVVHTDSYSSREWCHREVIAAKRCHVPMVVMDCLRDGDPRSVPYMGNVPIIRMNPEQDRIAEAIGYLLDDVFRTFIWHCRVRRFKATHPGVLFMVRPPELVALATLPTNESDAGSFIVHPGPPLNSVAAELFSEIAPDKRIQTLTEGLEEVA